MYCTKCGAQIADNAKTCSACGAPQVNTMFCKHCGQQIDADCIICPKCGKQVAELKQEKPTQPQVIINNTNSNVNKVKNHGHAVKPKNKWVTLLLLIFLGFFGAHKFYEGKIIMGIVYIFTGGLFVIGLIVDFFVILFKPHYYYV